MAFRAERFVLALLVITAPCLQARDHQLTEDDKLEIIRGLTAESGTVKTYLPRSKKPLAYESTGHWDKAEWEQIGHTYGPAARVGDLVEITKVTFEKDRILLEINHGLKAGGHWYDHVQVGMGTQTSPIGANQNSSAASGTNIALLFEQPIPDVSTADLKKMLAPIIDFSKQSVTENYVASLPAPIQKAIKEKKVIAGMDRDQVLMAVGKPRLKDRETRDGTDYEDWIYGLPPGIVTFVTFDGSKVVKVKEDYAGLGGSTVPRLPTN